MLAFRHAWLELMHKERKMKLNRKSGAKLAMTAAVLVVTGATLISAASAETVLGRCFGVNGCKGKGACKSAQNDCKGKNACGGKGWFSMLQEECKGAGGQWESI
jgi:hypothetical protein